MLLQIWYEMCSDQLSLRHLWDMSVEMLVDIWLWSSRASDWENINEKVVVEITISILFFIHLTMSYELTMY